MFDFSTKCNKVFIKIFYVLLWNSKTFPEKRQNFVQKGEMKYVFLANTEKNYCTVFYLRRFNYVYDTAQWFQPLEVIRILLLLYYCIVQWWNRQPWMSKIIAEEMKWNWVVAFFEHNILIGVSVMIFLQPRWTRTKPFPLDGKLIRFRSQMEFRYLIMPMLTDCNIGGKLTEKIFLKICTSRM